MSQPDAGSEPTGNETVAAPRETSQRLDLKVYEEMLASLFVATLILLAALLALTLPFFIYYYLGDHSKTAHDPPLLPIIAIAGAIGAFFSVLMRLYNLESLPKAIVAADLKGLQHIRYIYSLVPGVVGAIAALALHMLFASELLRSELFPAFVCKAGVDRCDTFAMVIGEWSPKQAPDYAKSIVWGFIGGFAERLVPDTLQILGQSAKDNKSG
jgi:hypothetical protein